jgi:A/G-specific adenine glycosylase
LSGCWIPDPRVFRRRLLAWYDAQKRDLPWRIAGSNQTETLYRVWVSEIMLQQTRVEAVIPYFHEFLERFPSLEALAAAPEPSVLAAWSGLGYYSRARNLQAAAQKSVTAGLPADRESLLALPGVGPYTAAAIASIVFREPLAAVDGNVLRVVSRLTNDAGEISSPLVRTRLGTEAQRLLDPRRPGDFNQAMMELGATVCIPRTPRCGSCPVAAHCEGRQAGRERELPVKARKPAARDIPLELLVLLRKNQVFLIPRGAAEKRLAGFLELPELRLFPGIKAEPAGLFHHRIVNDRFVVQVWVQAARSQVPRKLPPNGQWLDPGSFSGVPLSTISRKALHLANNFLNRRALVY